MIVSNISQNDESKSLHKKTTTQFPTNDSEMQKGSPTTQLLLARPSETEIAAVSQKTTLNRNKVGLFCETNSQLVQIEEQKQELTSTPQS